MVPRIKTRITRALDRAKALTLTKNNATEKDFEAAITELLAVAAVIQAAQTEIFHHEAPDGKESACSPDNRKETR